MNKEQINTNPVLKLSFEFSLQIIQYCEQLEAAKKFITNIEDKTDVAVTLIGTGPGVADIVDLRE